MLVNTELELPVRAEEIKVKSETDDFIEKIKPSEIRRDLPGGNFYSICDGMIINEERMVISYSQQKGILSEFHSGYPGMSRIKALMRSFVFWSGMDKDIEKTVRNCRGCDLTPKLPTMKSNSLPKEGLGYILSLRDYLMGHFIW